MTQATIVRSTRASTIAALVALLLLAGLAAAPWWAGSADLRLITEFLFYLALASMWNLLAGYAGLISVGQHAYVGLGGYLMFSCVLFLNMNPLHSIPVAGLVGGLISIPVALLVFRLKGPSFPTARQVTNCLQQCLVAWAVVQQLETQFKGILLARISHFVEKGLIEEIIHRMTDGTPETYDGRIVDMDLAHALVCDRVGLAGNSLDR